MKKYSKFRKPNKDGQIATKCIHFNFTGKHCSYFEDINNMNSFIEKDCEVLANLYCNKYE